LFSRTLLSLKGEEWRQMRHQISPAFTGSKLRNMVELITKTGHQFTKFLMKREDFEKPIDMREAFRRFSTDVISTTAFGSVSDSINDNQSEFYNNGVTLLDQSGLRGLTLMGYVLSPKLMSFLNIPFTPKKTTDFFTNIIEENIKYRETENKV
jgi:cytochrome P450